MSAIFNGKRQRERQDLLTNLPQETLGVVASYLPPEDLGSLIRTSKRCYAARHSPIQDFIKTVAIPRINCIGELYASALPDSEPYFAKLRAKLYSSTEQERVSGLNELGVFMKDPTIDPSLLDPTTKTRLIDVFTRDFHAKRTDLNADPWPLIAIIRILRTLIPKNNHRVRNHLSDTLDEMHEKCLNGDLRNAERISEAMTPIQREGKLYNVGKKYLEQDLAKAERIFGRLIEIDSIWAEWIGTGLIRKYLEQQDVGSAYRVADKLQNARFIGSKELGYQQVLELFSTYYINKKDLVQAVAVINKILRITPSPYLFGESLAKLSLAYQREGDFENGEFWADKISRHSQDVVAYKKCIEPIFNHYLSAKDFPHAERILDKWSLMKTADNSVDCSKAKQALAATKAGE